MSPRIRPRLVLAALGALALAAGTQLAAAGAAGATQQPAVSRACPVDLTPGHEACMALKRTDVTPALQPAAAPKDIPAGYGYGPAQLQAAYNLAAAATADGKNSTVAVVDAYDDPTAASDLAVYRAAAGLPAADLTKVNQNGKTSPLPKEAPASDDWTLEESLDLDMVSAVCPNCKIILVEATSDSGTSLYKAENAAASLAGYVSNSWGGAEAAGDTTLDTEYFDHPGVAITAATGDSGYGVIYPATSPYVVAVGGTALSPAANARGWAETVWGSTAGLVGTGSGCSLYEPKPSWQHDTGCAKRTDNDVAAVANPSTGLAVYDTSNGNGGWNEVGGTSASSPIIASVFALAGNAGTNPADDIYTHASDLYDITAGANGTCSPAYLCTAEIGYDGPSGWGTPDGISAFS
jgi:subtilase family serine protease